MNSAAPHSLPLILRAEPFGGSLFDSRDACQIEFDHEAYDFLCAHVSSGKSAETTAQQNLLAEVKKAVDFQRRLVRMINIGPFAMTTGDDPLLFGAPTICDFQITRRCDQQCPHCYAASDQAGDHLPYPDIDRVLVQLAECGVYQLALGGGEPMMHPDITKILRGCHELGIVVNLTTSGAHFDFDRLWAIKRYCGAVGLSLEAVGKPYEERRRQSFASFEKGVKTLLRLGIRTVLQVTLSAQNIAMLPTIVDFCLKYPRLYGVIFLAYKPVGRGRDYHEPLSASDPLLVASALDDALVRLGDVMRVGYDCCLAPALVEVLKAHQNDIEGCSALRGSVGITADLDVVPCTFLADRALGNLRTHTLRELFTWQGARQNFLDDAKKGRTQNPVCSGCPHLNLCLGGCPQMPLVNCRRRYLDAAKL